MIVDQTHYRTIWVHPEQDSVIRIIDQRHLPHQFIIEDIATIEQMATAIRDMHVRGAGLIGAAAGYGMYLAALEASRSTDFEQHLDSAARTLLRTRPTAVNLSWAIARQQEAIRNAQTMDDKVRVALTTANAIADEDVAQCRKIGGHGLPLIQELAGSREGPVNVLTHCNAGWLAFVDYGSATAPIYAAHAAGITVHVWVDETRPRNQGARLTAWELAQAGVPHTVISDNTGGHLMQQGLVDIVLVGTDRTTADGDVANKIGTYLKALAAKDNGVPFYVAVPTSSFDWEHRAKEIEIEQRSADEVRYVQGLMDGKTAHALITPQDTPAANYAFDITPARLVSGLITERGICPADRTSVLQMFPEKSRAHAKSVE